MAQLWVLFLIVVACLLPGGLLVSFASRKGGSFEGDRLAWIFASLLLGTAILGWIALILAELGLFSGLLVAFFWLVIVIPLSIWAIRQKTRGESGLIPVEPPQVDAREQSAHTRSWPAWVQPTLLAAWFAGSAILFFRPHEFVVGGADAGVYVNLAAHISQTGEILVKDPLLEELNPSLYPALLRVLPGVEQASNVAPYYLLPGFYVTDATEGSITPQFYPLHPVWQAVAFELGGLGPALLMTGLWALMGGLAIYFAAREIAGWGAAFLTLLGLSANALQIWFARYPTTEALTQFLLWSSLWAIILWLRDRQPRALWGFIAGFTLGEVFLVRIDTYFLLAIPLGILVWQIVSRRWNRGYWWFYGPIIALTAHSLAHAWWQSRPYLASIFGYGLLLLERYWWVVTGTVVLGLALLLVGSRYRGRLDQLARLKKPLTQVAALLVILLVLYGWFVRPALADLGPGLENWYGGEVVPAAINSQNLIRLGWYLSPLGIVIATAGICLMILEIDRQKAVILAAGLLFSLLYLWRIQANPHQIYAMRRYVPAVMPFAMVASGYLFGWLLRRGRNYQAIAWILVALWLAGLVISARGFVSQVDYQGIMAGLEEVEQRLEADSILLFDSQGPVTTGDLVGTPLRFLFGHPVFSLRDVQALDAVALRQEIQKWQRNGRTIYWVGEAAGAAELGIPLGQHFKMTVGGPQLEYTYEHKPSFVGQAEWQLTFAPILAES